MPIFSKNTKTHIAKGILSRPFVEDKVIFIIEDLLPTLEWKNVRNWGFRTYEEAEGRLFRLGAEKVIQENGCCTYRGKAPDERYGTAEMRVIEVKYKQDQDGNCSDYRTIIRSEVDDAHLLKARS